ncbi:MAG: ABC transporter ATP-binding protein [Alphaproteobacteria bacterium]
MNAALLDVVALEAGYEPGLPIVRGASLSVGEREIVVLLGPNGAGKSTLIKAVAGLVRSTAGSVRLEGRDITGERPFRLPGLGLAFVPQTDNVFGTLSVRENLDLAAAILPRRRRAGAIDRALTLFPDLAAQRRLAARRLSGGQRQMLAAARGLIVEPRLIMLDEPSAGLSPKLVDSVFGQLARIRDAGVSILLVEQNVRAGLAIADRGYVLVEGRERLSGARADLVGNPAIGALFLGGVPAGGTD